MQHKNPLNSRLLQKRRVITYCHLLPFFITKWDKNGTKIYTAHRNIKDLYQLE